MKNLVSFSGGKDSTAMLLMMLERGEPVDRAIYFDCGKWEFPQMADHINKVEKYTGVKIERLHGDYPFDYYMYDKVITRGHRKGKQGYGWPSYFMRWCTYRKLEAINAVQNSETDATVFIGFAADELQRKEKAKHNHKHIIPERYPLIEWGVTGEMATKYCKEHGFDWGGLYDHFKRVSCWCCPLQPLSALRILRSKYPDLWTRLMEMDEHSFRQFRRDYSVKELERKFQAEENKSKQGKLL